MNVLQLYQTILITESTIFVCYILGLIIYRAMHPIKVLFRVTSGAGEVIRYDRAKIRINKDDGVSYLVFNGLKKRVKIPDNKCLIPIVKKGWLDPAKYMVEFFIDENNNLYPLHRSSLGEIKFEDDLEVMRTYENLINDSIRNRYKITTSFLTTIAPWAALIICVFIIAIMVIMSTKYTVGGIKEAAGGVIEGMKSQFSGVIPGGS